MLVKKGIFFLMVVGLVTLSNAQKTGIGTNTPSARFHLAVPGTWADSIFMITHGTNTPFVITQSGRVGIGTASPSHSLHIVGTVQVDSLATGGTNAIVIVRPDGTLGFLLPSGNVNDVLRGDLTWGPYPGSGTSDTFWIDAGQYIYSKHFKSDTVVITDSGWLGIGITNPGAPLHITGPLVQRGISQSVVIGERSGAVLDFALASHLVIVGYRSGYGLVDPSSSVALGALTMEKGPSDMSSIAVGYSALRNASSTSYNIAIGSFSQEKDSAGSYNLSVGFRSLASCVSCDNNIAVGNLAMRNLTAGSRNIAIGQSALYTITNGTSNIAIGYGSLAREKSTLLTSPQIAIGNYSLSQDTAGTLNVAIGYYSAGRTRASIGVVAIGSYAAENISSPRYSVVIGNEAGRYVSYIENSALAGFQSGQYVDTVLNSIIIGNGSSDSVNLINNSIVVGYHSGSIKDSLSNSVVIGNNSVTKKGGVVEVVSIGDSTVYGSGKSSIVQGVVAIGPSAHFNLRRSKADVFNRRRGSVGIGYKALYNDTAELGHVAIGERALTSFTGKTLSHFLTAIGHRSLSSLKTHGSYVASIGYGSMRNVDSAERSYAIGYLSLSNAVVANRAIAIGSRTLSQITDATRTVAIGYRSIGDALSFSLRQYGIGAYALVQAGSSDNIGIGDSVMASCGTCMWNVAIGSKSLKNNISGNFNTAIGYHTIRASDTASNNTAIGYKALDNARTGDNTAIGSYALGGIPNITGRSNTAVGFLSMGRLSGIATISGSNNVSVGAKSLSNLNNGDYNTAIGFGTLAALRTGNSNVAIGFRSGQNISQGQENVIVGSYSLFADTLSYGNITVGGGAMSGLPQSVQSGNYNIAIGNRAAYYGLPGNFNIVIGHNAADSMLITGNHNVIIGTYAISINDSANHNISFNTIVGPGATLTGNFDNATALGVNASVTASNRIHIGDNSITEIWVMVPWSTYSDQRFKRNVRYDVPGLDFILKLRPVSYIKDVTAQSKEIYKNRIIKTSLPDNISLQGTYTENTYYVNQESMDTIRWTGFIAQEVDSVAKAIGYNFSGVRSPGSVGGDGISYTLTYSDFVAPLVKAVQEQQDLIEKNEHILISQENRIRQLEQAYYKHVQHIQMLKEQINSLKAKQQIVNNDR